MSALGLMGASRADEGRCCGDARSVMAGMHSCRAETGRADDDVGRAEMGLADDVADGRAEI